MASQIIDPEGKSYQRLPVIEYANLKLPVLEMDRDALKSLPAGTNPLALMVALLDQTSSQNNVIWAGMHALAKDIYSHLAVPKDDRHFQKFAEDIGLRLTDLEGSVLDVGEDLKN
jgi:hypothetical protein